MTQNNIPDSAIAFYARFYAVLALTVLVIFLGLTLIAIGVVSRGLWLMFGGILVCTIFSTVAISLIIETLRK